MLKQIEEYGKYIEITGFKNVKIGDTARFLQSVRMVHQQGVIVQFFNAELVATWQHLYFAALNALTAFKNNSSISKDLAMGILLYSSAQRQIRKALALIGVKNEFANIAMIVLSENPDSVKAVLDSVSRHVGVQPDETVLALTRSKLARLRKAFDIAETELDTVTKKGDTQQALVDLIIEKMALLSTQL